MEFNYDKILKCELLTVDEEVELTKKYSETKDSIILEKLVEANLRFVYRVAKEYHIKNKSIPFDDLFNEGCAGLINGINKFDPTKGFKLISYVVWWIRRDILEYLNIVNGVKIPGRITKLSKEINRFKEKYLSEFGNEPSLGTIIDSLDYTENEIINSMIYSTTNVVKYNDLGTPEVDFISNYSEIADDSDILVNERINTVLNRVKNERDKYILINYFGVGVKSKTYKELGEELGISSSRVAAINNKTMRRLRSNVSTNRLVRVPRPIVKKLSDTIDVSTLPSIIDQDIIKQHHGPNRVPFNVIADELDVPTSLIKRRYIKAISTIKHHKLPTEVVVESTEPINDEIENIENKSFFKRLFKKVKNIC